jgi:hypothetical protein
VTAAEAFGLPVLLDCPLSNAISIFRSAACRLPLAACRSRFTSNPDLAHVGRATLGQGIARVRHVIWDETSGRLIPFRELQNRLNAGPVDGAKPQTDAL